MTTLDAARIVTSEAAAALDAALFDGAPANERLLDACAGMIAGWGVSDVRAYALPGDFDPEWAL